MCTGTRKEPARGGAGGRGGAQQQLVGGGGVSRPSCPGSPDCLFLPFSFPLSFPRPSHSSPPPFLDPEPSVYPLSLACSPASLGATSLGSLSLASSGFPAITPRPPPPPALLPLTGSRLPLVLPASQPPLPSLFLSLPFLPSPQPLFPHSPAGERAALPPPRAGWLGFAPAAGAAAILQAAGEGAASVQSKQYIFYEALPATPRLEILH